MVRHNGSAAPIVPSNEAYLSAQLARYDDGRAFDVRHEGSRFRTRKTLLIALATGCVAPFSAAAQEAAPVITPAPTAQGGSSPVVTPTEAPQEGLQDVVVTARRNSESLQRVPDAISAVTSETIVNAGIKSVADLAQVAPGLNFRNGRAYQGNFFDLRVRGIGQAQGGWPSVAFIGDGVPAPSSDALTQGSLADVERIEILRGPQSALYGANAIAGAINVITKRPTDEVHGEVRGFYGNGNDFQGGAAVSGPVAKDLLYARISASGTHDDGRIESATNGLPLDAPYSQHYALRLISTPASNFEADFKVSYDKSTLGFAFQDRVPSVAFLNDYRSSFYPARSAAGNGRQHRDSFNLSLRLKWDIAGLTVTTVSSYAQAHQNGVGTGCYYDVNNPGVFAAADGSIICISSIHAFGNRAANGQAIEAFQSALDNYRTGFQDVRIASSSSGPFQWLIGADGMIRRALDGNTTFYTVQQAAAVGTTLISSRFDERGDDWWGVYGQLRYTLGKLEVSAAGRYDNQLHRDEGYRDTGLITPIQATNPDGSPTLVQRVRERNFQPKGQISYHFDDDKMIYVTVSKGYRAGYFNTGNYGTPEKTTNYEGGFKTEFLNRRLRVNASGFHTDYSNQQLSTTLLLPPYRTPVTVPQTTINGGEADVAFQLFRGFTLGGNVSYLDAVVTGPSSATVKSGTESPKSPHWSGSVNAQYTRNLFGNWSLNAHGDVTVHDQEYLYINNTQSIPGNHFVNARVGIENGRFGIYLAGQNLTNTIEDQTNAGINAIYAARYRNEPRSYGVEVRAKF